MFNNYKFNLHNHPQVQQLFQEIPIAHKNMLISAVNILEEQINELILEKENILESVNQLQQQTQNKLDSEYIKNHDLQKQLHLLQEQITTQNTQISFLDKSLKQKYHDEDDIFSPKKNIRTSPKLITQSINKHKRTILVDKENLNGASSVKKKPSRINILEDTDLKQNFLQEPDTVDNYLRREQYLLNVFNSMQHKLLEKNKILMTYINDLVEQVNTAKIENTKLYEYAQKVQVQFNRQRSIYQVFLQQIRSNGNTSLSNCLDIQKSILELSLSDKSIQFPEFGELTGNIESLFTALREQISSLKDELFNNEKQYKIEIDQRNQQIQQLLDLGQDMDEELIDLKSAIEAINIQVIELTSQNQLYESQVNKLIDENAQLKEEQSQLTSRTSKTSAHKHYVQNRFSSTFDKYLSCKNSIRADNSHEDRKSGAEQDVTEIIQILEHILNEGFDNQMLEVINKFSCRGGNFKHQVLWQKIKDLLLRSNLAFIESDCLLKSINNFIKETKIIPSKFTYYNTGVLFLQQRGIQNSQLICDLLHNVLDKIHNLKTSVIIASNTPKKIEKQGFKLISSLSEELLRVSCDSDKQIIAQIEQQVRIQEQFKSSRNKGLRNLQTSTCRMLMEIFKCWKQERVEIAEILLNGDLDFNLRQHNLEFQYIIMNSMIEFLFQNSYGSSSFPLREPGRVLDVESLVQLIASFLSDQDLLQFVQINRNIIQIASKNQLIKIRVLEIRLKRQTRILDTYIQEPENLHHKQSAFMFRDLSQIQIPQGRFVNLLNLFNRKQKPVQQLPKKQHDKIEVPIQIPQQQLHQQQPSIPQTIAPRQQPQTPMQEAVNQTYLVKEFEKLMLDMPKQYTLQQGLTKISRNLCPVVQYKRIKSVMQYIKEPRDVKHL